MIDDISQQQYLQALRALHVLNRTSVFEHLLSASPIVQVTFSDHMKLQIPDSVRPKPGETVTFEYGLDMPIQIPDLKVTDEGISATLSFNRTPCPTFVPWEAVVRFGVVPAQSTENVPPKVTRPKLTLVP
jgi:hypothetical protein